MHIGRCTLTLMTLWLAASATSLPVSAAAMPEVFPYCDRGAIYDGWVEQADDVRKLLRETRADDNLRRFVKASDSTVDQLEQLFHALNREDLDAAGLAAEELGYKGCLLRKQRGDSEDRFLFLSKDQTQQIHLLWRFGDADPIIIQSPHTFKDNRDNEKATASFVETRARLLIINSLHSNASEVRSPCSGDNMISNGAHYDKGWFHAAHLASARVLPDHGVFQFHGMASRKKNGDVVYIDISPGFVDRVKQDSLLRYFDNALAQSFATDYLDKIVSAAKPSPWTKIKSGTYHPATFNTQGRHLNGSLEPCRKGAGAQQYNNSPQRFVHLELSSNPRQHHFGELVNAINLAAAQWRAKLENESPKKPRSLYSAKLQVGSAQVGDRPQPLGVTLENYGQAVVIAGIPSFEGSHSVVAEAITGATPALQLREWEYLDGWHRYESVPYLISDRGRFKSPELQLEADRITISASDEEKSIQFQVPFDGNPIVLLTEQDKGPDAAVALRIADLNPRGFTVKAFVSEQSQERDVKPGVIQVGYVALYSRSAETGEAVSLPLHGGQVTTLGFDRFEADHKPGRHGVFIQEEQSRDKETSHIAEEVGLLLIDGQTFGHLQTLKGTDPATLRQRTD